MRKSKNKPFYFLLRNDFVDTEVADGYFISPDQSEQCKACSLLEVADMLEDSGAQEVIIGIPGSRILQVFVDAPNVSGTKLDKALYWSIEPFLSTDIEDNEIFWSKTPTSERPSRILITAIAKRELDKWQQQLVNAKLPSAKLVLLKQILTQPDDQPNSCIQWEGSTLWENNEGAGCFKRELFLQLATTASARATNAASNICNDFTDRANDVEKIQALRKALQNNLPEKLINFNTEHENKNPWKEYFSWKPLMAASLACCMLATGYFLVMGKQFDERANEQMHASVTQYQTWFPNDQRIFDLQRQLQGKLRQGVTANTGEGFVSIIESTANGIDENTNSYELQRLRFSGDNSTLEVVSIFESMDIVQLIEGSLKSSGLDMVVQSATRKSAGIEVGFTVETERQSPR